MEFLRGACGDLQDAWLNNVFLSDNGVAEVVGRTQARTLFQLAEMIEEAKQEKKDGEPERDLSEL